MGDAFGSCAPKFVGRWPILGDGGSAFKLCHPFVRLVALAKFGVAVAGVRFHARPAHPAQVGIARFNEYALAEPTRDTYPSRNWSQ